MHCSRRLIVQSLVFSRSYLHHQVSPPETLVVKGGTTWARSGQWILPENARPPRNIQGSFTCRKSTTRYKRLYFPSERRPAEDFFSPWKIRRLRPGLNPRTWVPKASQLPLDQSYSLKSSYSQFSTLFFKLWPPFGCLHLVDIRCRISKYHHHSKNHRHENLLS